MNLNELFDRKEFLNLISGFPETLKNFAADPFFKKGVPVLEKAPTDKQMFAGYLLILIASLIYFLLTDWRLLTFINSPFALAGTIFLEILMGIIMVPIGALIGYLIVMVLGFRGSFTAFAGIVLAELPITWVAMFASSALSFVHLPGLAILESLMLLALMLVGLYRLLLRCWATKPQETPVQ